VGESYIERKVCEWAKSVGILPIKFTPMGETGWPDRVFLYCGQAVFIEFKAPGRKARPLQLARIKQLQSYGFTVGVYDNVELAIGFLGTSLLPS
jgi:hypothetical protein